MPLDRAAVAHYATRARIKVPEGERDAMAKELDGILHWVEQLKEVDTAQVEPMTGDPQRGLITSGDGDETWGTVGVADNIIEASWQALVDSVEYKLRRDDRRGRR
mgnify:CR=1 FL=1